VSQTSIRSRASPPFGRISHGTSHKNMEVTAAPLLVDIDHVSQFRIATNAAMHKFLDLSIC